MFKSADDFPVDFGGAVWLYGGEETIEFVGKFLAGRNWAVLEGDGVVLDRFVGA